MELLKKLNFKNQKEIFLLNAPETFISQKLEMSALTHVKETVDSNDIIDFVLVFVENCEEISSYAELVLTKIKGDGIVWFVYPKKSSKNYKTPISRDIGWESIGNHKFESVRQISIDDDWSGIRFRKIDYIKNFTREEKNAVSAVGKARASSTCTEK